MKRTTSTRLAAAMLAAAMLATAITGPLAHANVAGGDQPALRTDAYPQKPQRAEFGPRFSQSRITVKFRDGLNVRLRNGALTDFNTGALRNTKPVFDQLAGATWHRTHTIDETRLTALREDAVRTARQPMPDLNLQYDVVLPPGTDPAAAIDLLNSLECVEMAQAIPLLAPPPLPPSYEPKQNYLRSAAVGIGAETAWNMPGGRGENVKIADIEYSWNLAHQDLPPVTVVGPASYDPFNDKNHGTAVLGILGAKDNGWGTTGLVPEADLLVVGALTGPSANIDAHATQVADAILRAANAIERGDIILIEQQIFGPNSNPCCVVGGCPIGTDCQFGLVPVEWFKPIWDAMVVAANAGRVIIEAAGNGSQNLNDPIYQQGNNGHWPFQTGPQPPGAANWITVGAGGAPLEAGGSQSDRSRLPFSNYGWAVDLQGWGECVWTTGYGLALGPNGYTAGGTNQLYTGHFGGTSSASPMVAAAAAILQSVYKEIVMPAQNSTQAWPLSADDIRTLLQQTGSMEQGYWPPHLPPPPPPLPGDVIGPRPDVAAALRALGALTQDEMKWCQASWSPQLDAEARMVFDEARGVAVLYGASTQSMNVETWEFDGTNWTQVWAWGPGIRYGQQMVYDSARGKVVLYGGYFNNTILGDMWEYDGAQWTQIFPQNSPGPRYRFGMAYDRDRQRTVVFGGYNWAGLSNETWEYDGVNWSLRSTSGPVPGERMAMAYDDGRNKTVMTGSWQAPEETWEWNGSAWTKRIVSPAGAYSTTVSSMAYDADRQLIMMVDNSYVLQFNSTHEFDGTSWTLVNRTNGFPQGVTDLQAVQLAYDTHRDEMLMWAFVSNGQYATLLRYEKSMGFTQLPASHAIQAGQSTTFIVGVSNAQGAHYQWFKDNQPLTDGNGISGAHTSTLSISNAAPTHSGQYTVMVTSNNPCESLNTNLVVQGWSPSWSGIGMLYVAPVLCAQDVNGDGAVGIADLLAVIGAWGTCPLPCTPPSSHASCPADINDDCIVGIADLLAVIGAWGACGP